ncbi:MAG: DUF1580 domain-containing protein [Phycisphaerales bacterium]
MIQIAHEQLIALRDAPKHLPPRPGGKRVHISAVYRWITKGVSGVVLEAVRIGGTTYTSLEALQRFADRLSEPPPRVTVTGPAASARLARNAAQRALEIELGLPLGDRSQSIKPGDHKATGGRSENAA